VLQLAEAILSDPASASMDEINSAMAYLVSGTVSDLYASNKIST